MTCQINNYENSKVGTLSKKLKKHNLIQFFIRINQNSNVYLILFEK